MAKETNGGHATTNHKPKKLTPTKLTITIFLSTVFLSCLVKMEWPTESLVLGELLTMWEAPFAWARLVAVYGIL